MASQALVYCPALAEFLMSLMRRLVERKIWTKPKLWTGFVKCCAMPAAGDLALPVLLLLPAAQLKQVVESQPDLGARLVSYAATQAASLPPASLEALGLNDDDE